MLAVDICWTYADICCCLEDGGATTKSRPQSSYLTIFETYKDVVREKKWTHARYYLRPGTASKLGSRAPAQAVPLRTLGFNSCFFFHAFTFDDTFKTRLRFSRADSKVCCSLLEIFTFFSHHHGIPSQVGSNNTSLLFRLIQFHGKN